MGDLGDGSFWLNALMLAGPAVAILLVRNAPRLGVVVGVLGSIAVLVALTRVPWHWATAGALPLIFMLLLVGIGLIALVLTVGVLVGSLRMLNTGYWLPPGTQEFPDGMEVPTGAAAPEAARAVRVVCPHCGVRSLPWNRAVMASPVFPLRCDSCQGFAGKPVLALALLLFLLLSFPINARWGLLNVGIGAALGGAAAALGALLPLRPLRPGTVAVARAVVAGLAVLYVLALFQL